MKYHNFTDDHVPSPSQHAPRTESYVASGTMHQDRRLVVAEDDVTRWVACPVEDAVPVKQ